MKNREKVHLYDCKCNPCSDTSFPLKSIRQEIIIVIVNIDNKLDTYTPKLISFSRQAKQKQNTKRFSRRVRQL